MSTERWTIEVAPAGGPWHTDLNGAVFYTSRDGALPWATWLCGTWPAVRLHGDITVYEVLRIARPGNGGPPGTGGRCAVHRPGSESASAPCLPGIVPACDQLSTRRYNDLYWCHELLPA
jgi:hypothetical protein